MTIKTQTLFESAPVNPPDSIFGLIEEYKQDRRPNKINLSVGVYQDEQGQTPVMHSVRRAEQLILEESASKNYLPIDGIPSYCDLVGRLVLGEAADQFPWATAQTPGGTVALRIAGELLKRVFNVQTIWISNPTWANHPQIYEAVGFQIRPYDYLDEQKTGLDFQRILDSLSQASAGDAVLLHTVCHNPTGVDLSVEHWEELFNLIQSKSLFAIFDFAYQGFGEDVVADSLPIQMFARSGGEALICNSFSKNFGLYAERVGGITAIAQAESSAIAMKSQIQANIRTLYSNPPLHGGMIVQTILSHQELREQWLAELAEIRNRIQNLRIDFVAMLKEFVPDRDFSYILQQRGMFSYSGLTPDQVDRLKEAHAIYALKSGRINVAGINRNNMAPICQAIKAVF